MSAYWTLLRKDVHLEVKSHEIAAQVVVFAFLMVVLLGFSLPTGAPAQSLGGLVWIGIFFPAYLAHGRSFASELQAGSLEELIFAPVPAWSLFFEKFTFNLLVIVLLSIVEIPLYVAALSVHILGPLWLLALTFFLGAVGFSAVGTTMAALTMRLRFQEMILPLAIFPVLVPLIISVAVLTGGIFSGHLASGLWLDMLVVFDVIYVAVPLLLFDVMLEV